MPVLINVLREDQADLEIIHAALEALYTVCTPKRKVRRGVPTAVQAPYSAR